MTAKDRLIVFVKLPAAGSVKTRLAKKIGAERAADLYRCLVADTIAAANRTGYPVVVCFHPPGSSDAIAGWLGTGMTYLPQEGRDLGERMAGAFRKLFPGCARAVLIGSDAPDLPPAIVHEAFDALTTHQAVIGPAGDGGYYLIGFGAHGFTDAPFKGIAWGRPTVFEETMAVFRGADMDVHVLPAWSDIDEYEDLKALYRRHETLPPGRSATIDFLRDHMHW